MNIDLARNGHIDLSKHDAVYICGDVHGDMFALLKVLELSGCVQIAPLYFQQSAKCWSNYTSHTRSSTRSTVTTGAQLKDIQHSITWTGGTSVVVFLGDILDNKRGSSGAKNGNCAWEGTQYQMLDILVELKRQSNAQRGNMIWVLGNHDIWNISPIVRTCNRYSPQFQQKCTDDRCEKSTKICTDSGGYTTKHRQLIKKYMRQMGAVGLVRITAENRKGKTHVLGMHGGITNVNFFRNKRFKRSNKHTNKVLTLHIQETQFEENIDAINEVYIALQQPEDEEELFRYVESPYAPTWCRPETIENGKDLKRYFGTSKMCKAHDVQMDGANCNVDGKSTNGVVGKVFKDNELCRMDVAMSRAFDKPGREREKEFSLVRLWEGPQGMMRKINSVYETMDGNMEYARYIK